MRLRTRLMIALLPLAVVPLAVVLPVAQANLRRTLSRELEGRLEAAHAAAAAALDKRAEEVRRSMDELADSAALEEVARTLHGGAPPARVAGQATRLMSARGLTVLSLFDAQGTTVSSGHLPARVGDPDPRLFAASLWKDPAPSWALVERRDASGIREVPALVAARAVDYGRVRVWAVGGAYLDASLARHLAGLTGTRVELLWAGQVQESAGSAAPPVLARVLQLGDGVGVRLAISSAAQREAEAGITRAFLGLAVVGVLLTLLLGFYVARRISRSVEALTAGAQRVAGGDLDAKVTARASGEVGELIGAFNQMTQQLRTQTERLVASERIAAWQDVARRLAHELKNPLTPIKMSLETLLAARELNSPRFGELFGESATVILEEVERLRRTIDEFSRFARLPKPQLEEVTLDALLGQVLALYASPRAGVTVVPQLQPGVTVRADPDQLTQVLLNLIKNADEAMPEGGTIRVRLRTGKGQAVIEVEDTGKGIPPEDRARVLEPYFTQKEGGTGLGLSIASRICQEHGGALEVDGAPGGGALMRVVLPLPESVSP